MRKIYVQRLARAYNWLTSYGAVKFGGRRGEGGFEKRWILPRGLFCTELELAQGFFGYNGAKRFGVSL